MSKNDSEDAFSNTEKYYNSMEYTFNLPRHNDISTIYTNTQVTLNNPTKCFILAYGETKIQTNNTTVRIVPYLNTASFDTNMLTIINPRDKPDNVRYTSVPESKYLDKTKLAQTKYLIYPEGGDSGSPFVCSRQQKCITWAYY